MGVEIVVDGATVECPHKGSASPTVTSTRVKLDGKAVVTLGGPWSVKGCTYPPASGPPDTSIVFSTGSLRVKVEGKPVVLTTSQGTCAATGGPAVISLAGQTRVKGL